MEHSTRETNSVPVEGLRRELQQLSTDIHKALEEEERLLTRLESAPRADVWAALRNNDTAFVKRSRRDASPENRDDATSREEPKEESSPNKAMTFGEYSGLDSSSKRARIRSGLQRQQEKIRSLLERIQQRDAATKPTTAQVSSAGSI